VVYQGGWDDISLTSYSSSYKNAPNLQAQVDLRVREDGAGRDKVLMASFRLDFLLVRNQVRGVQPDQDYKNILFGFQFANVPSINSLESIYNFQERPWVFAQLNRIRGRIGQERFPLIDHTYYSTYRDMIITPKFPIVVKIGHAHAGFGKVRMNDHHDFADLRGVVALTSCYCTAEPFVEGEYDLRIQKIGNTYRAFKRIGLSGSWKTNTGCAILEPIELTPQYKMWVDECSTTFGGLEILAVDAIHHADGSEFILEVNDTSIGLCPDFEEEDQMIIADLVLSKILSL